jgi:CMP-N-acetylneuraminic acid synthetase
LARVILSTDSEEIAAVGKSCGVEVPFLRPAELAADQTPSLPVMRHLLDWLEAEGDPVHAVVLLQPTSPLRQSDHIDEAADLFERSAADTVVSVTEVPHRFHPSSLLKERDGVLVPYHDGQTTATSRHGLEPFFARNGPAILISSARTLKEGRLYGARTLGYRMPEENSIDIDRPHELRLAELMLEARELRAK